MIGFQSQLKSGKISLAKKILVAVNTNWYLKLFDISQDNFFFCGLECQYINLTSNAYNENIKCQQNWYYIFISLILSTMHGGSVLHRFTLLFSSLLIVMFLTMGCSSKSNDLVTSPDSSSNTPQPEFTESGHNLAGMWDLTLNPDTLEAIVTPSRDLAGHMNITTMVGTNLQVLNYDPLTQTYSINFTITNNYSLFGYDVRLILFTNDEGLMLSNADAWTDLYDVIGGLTRNPFKAFAEGELLHKFGAYQQHTEDLQVYVPQPSGPIVYAVDVSWPSNCTEPYDINDFSHTQLLEDAGSVCDLEISVFDWQDDISTVSISTLPITGTYYTHFTYNSGEGVWETLLTNSEGATFGDYECLVVATSGSSSLYDYATISITQTGCPLDGNQNCTTATSIGANELIAGCVDTVDMEDWFEIIAPPNGITGGTVNLEIQSGSCYMIVYSCEDEVICPGTMVAFDTNVVLPTSTATRYYIRVFSSGDSAYYRLSTDIEYAITSIECDVYVATSGSPYYNWPIWEVTGPDIELTMAHLNNLMSWNNSFWNQYGYALDWDGTVTEISSQYYYLNSQDESRAMHVNNGKGTGKLSLYFVDVLNGDIQTAYCVPNPSKILHNPDNVYTAYSPNVWYWENVVAHEHGHAFGYFIDEYLFDVYSLPCGDTSGFPYGVPRYLYADPDGCYMGNLMYYAVPEWSWSHYDLTPGQENYVNWFHLNYPDNFIKH